MSATYQRLAAGNTLSVLCIGSGLIPARNFEIARERAKIALVDLAPELVLVGIVDWFGLYVAELCAKMKIPFIAVVTYTDMRSIQDLTKIEKDRLIKIANQTLSATKINDLESEMPTETFRDAWLIKHGDIMLTVCDKKERLILRHAKSENKKICYVNAEGPTYENICCY